MVDFYDAKKDICTIADKYQANKKEDYCARCDSCFVVCIHSKDINF